MPPPDSERAFPDDEVELLRRWIDEGAVYQKHWSFEPPKSREEPETSNPNWSRNRIDTFVLAKLEAEASNLPNLPIRLLLFVGPQSDRRASDHRRSGCLFG